MNYKCAYNYKSKKFSEPYIYRICFNDLPYYWVNSAQYGVQLFEIRENYNYFENIFIKALIYC